MADSALTSITKRMRRLLNETVVSGTFSQTDLEYYAQDALSFIPSDYTGFGSYTIVVGSGISSTPTDLDSVLISLKASAIAFNSIIIEGIADAIMVKAGSITLDTTKSLRSRGIQGNKFDSMYSNLVDSLLINGSDAVSNAGFRLDNYKKYNNETSDSESLI